MPTHEEYLKVCPRCKGRKEFDCPDCYGTGKVTDERALYAALAQVTRERDIRDTALNLACRELRRRAQRDAEMSDREPIIWRTAESFRQQFLAASREAGK